MSKTSAASEAIRDRATVFVRNHLRTPQASMICCNTMKTRTQRPATTSCFHAREHVNIGIVKPLAPCKIRGILLAFRLLNSLIRDIDSVVAVCRIATTVQRFVQRYHTSTFLQDCVDWGHSSPRVPAHLRPRSLVPKGTISPPKCEPYKR